MKETIKLGIVLFIFAAVAALVLGFTNKVTNPIITERERIATEKAYKELLPDADSFEAVSNDELKTIQEKYKKVTSVVKAMKNGEQIGVLITSNGGGYGGDITIMTGVMEDKIKGIKILKHKETPQIGTKIENQEFQDRFKELDATNNIRLVSEKKEPQDVDKITGSTVSSRGVASAVNLAIDCYKEIKNGL